MSRRTPEWWCAASELKAGLAERTIRSGRIVSASQALKSLLDLGATLVLARLLVPKDFGLVGMAAAITGFMALLHDLGLAQVTVQRNDLEPADVNSLFWLNVLLGALLTGFLAITAPLIAAYYGDGRLTDITRLLSLGFLLNGASVQHRALLRRRMLHGRLALVDLVVLVTGVASSLGLALAGMGYWALVARGPIGALVGAGAVWIACDFRPGWSRSSRLGTLLRAGGNLTGFSLINYLARNLDNVLIGRYAGAEALGLYARAYDLLLLPIRLINEPLSGVAIPSLSRLADEPERLRQAFLRMLEKVLLLCLPLGAFLMSASDAVVVLVLGSHWAGAGPIFFWLGWSTFTQPIGNAVGWLFIAQNRSGEMLRWGVVGSALAVASFVLGLPWGAEGVAAAYSLSGIAVRTPLLLSMMSKSGSVRARDVLGTAAPIVLTSVAALGLTSLVRRSLGPLHPGLTVALCAVLCISATLFGLSLFASGRRGLADLFQLANWRRNTRR